MKRVALSVSLILLLAIPAALALSTPPEDAMPGMLTLLKRGQSVQLEKALSGGYNINVLTEKYVESFKGADENYVPTTVTKVGREYIVVRQSLKTKAFTRGFEQAISAHAIHAITLLQDQERIVLKKRASNNPARVIPL